jgi:alpha-beta hydrolase superfamily lysophospholipase
VATANHPVQLGDVHCIDQYATDVADVILAPKKEKSMQKIILSSHSMGGGIALRYAQNESSKDVKWPSDACSSFKMHVAYSP